MKVHPTARINVDHLEIGPGAVIGKDCVIEGHRVSIGRDFWMDEGAVIGGGSCHDPSAYLVAGDWLHMGRDAQINIARGVTIGHEAGIGIETKIFTHGAYQSEWDGFPVDFAPVVLGDRVWLPNAWVNPGVTIGSDVVVAARSLVNRDLPYGCLAGGVPVKVLREHAYPRALTVSEQLACLKRICFEVNSITRTPCCIMGGPLGMLDVDGTLFDLVSRAISGPATAYAEVARNQLRRHGIRFRYSAENGEYVRWPES